MPVNLMEILLFHQKISTETLKLPYIMPQKNFSNYNVMKCAVNNKNY